jgi:hypothetical protein
VFGLTRVSMLESENYRWPPFGWWMLAFG